MKFRGWLAVAFASLSLVVCDVIQRLFVAPAARLLPSKRLPILSGWMKIMAWMVTRPVSFLGGFTIPRPERLTPARPGVLVLMNHQSLFDIPLVIQTVAKGYPRIVTRKRYINRYIPVISQMVRLYQYPVVDPSANREEIVKDLRALEAAAKETELPIAVFPEGTRTRDGEIGEFRLGGLTRLLKARSWTVYMYVADGFWQAARYKEFVAGAHSIDGRFAFVGTLEWPDPTADPEPFIEEARGRMIEALAEIRSGAAVA